MTNHIHLVANVEDGPLGDFLRDFKTYTSKELIKIISSNLSESRRDWMIRAFEQAGKQNPLNKNHQFWQNGKYSAAVIQQKIDYIHDNPVRAGFVGSAHEFWYSTLMWKSL